MGARAVCTALGLAMRHLISPIVLAAFLFACGSDTANSTGAIGTTCSQSGANGQCSAGAVCGKPSDGTTALLCLKTCTLQTDCSLDQDCNGVDGTTQKGCRPKAAADGGSDGGKK
jgi:hypothetical protein